MFLVGKDTDGKGDKTMNVEINQSDKNLLELASELYSVPFDMLASVYRLGRNDGYIKGLDWRAK